MALTWTRLPFRYEPGEYPKALADYVGHVFYDLLPEAGYEVREDQIYTSYRIAGAMAARKILLAEAGLGTGKTFAYLVPAICHAREHGAPVVIACSSPVLQEQLAGQDGDTAALSRALGLQVDARLAREPREYICELKIATPPCPGKQAHRGLDDLLGWAQRSERGERREVPDVADPLWEMVAWDPTLGCDACAQRGHCRMVRAREHYRQSTDLIICSHRLFFADLWTRRERQEAGLLPLLPAYSGVVFDEGHLIPDAAQLAAGHELTWALLRETLEGAGEISDRAAYRRSVQAARGAAEGFAAALTRAVDPGGSGPGAPSAGASHRLHVIRTPGLTEAAVRLAMALEALGDEMVTEEAMNEGTATELFARTLQARLDQFTATLAALRRPPADTVTWASPSPGAPDRYDLWTVPRRTDRMLERELYARRIPVLFSSATLSAGGSFDYLKRVLGAPKAEHSHAGTPFDLQEQALIYLPGSDETRPPVARLVQVLRAVQGRTLVLVSSQIEQGELRSALEGEGLPWTLLWEGDADRAELLRRFRTEVDSVLIGSSFWEGIDVPGEALSCVAVLRLPFPPDDPVLVARREDAAAAGLDPFLAADVPAMTLKLKQGRGRLVRTADDRGVFALLDVSFRGTPHEDAVRSALPEEAEETADLVQVRAFLNRDP